jgi:hypothetical protein
MLELWFSERRRRAGVRQVPRAQARGRRGPQGTQLPYHAGSSARNDWREVLDNSVRVPHELARLERRQLKMREAMRLLLNVVKNPKAKGIDEMLINVYNTLLFWEDD